MLTVMVIREGTLGAHLMTCGANRHSGWLVALRRYGHLMVERRTGAFLARGPRGLAASAIAEGPGLGAEGRP